MAFYENDSKNDDNTSVIQMIKNHFKKETLDGDNKYFCDKCNAKVAAHRYASIKHTSKYLIVCLKRFAWDLKTMKRRKIMTVTFRYNIYNIIYTFIHTIRALIVHMN